MRGVRAAPGEIEEERQRAARFFKGSGRVAPVYPPQTGGRRAAPRRPANSLSALAKTTALDRRVAAARLSGPLRLLMLALAAFCVWQVYLWWTETRPNPHLLSAQFATSSAGYVVSFTVVNQGGAGTIEMTPQLVLRNGQVVSGLPLPESLSHFRKKETKRLSAMVTAGPTQIPTACTVNLRPPHHEPR